MYCRDQESLNWLAQCTWLMAADQYLIVLPRFCIGSLQGKASIESQSIQSIMPIAGVHGLSAQDGALRPLKRCLSVGARSSKLYPGVRRDAAAMARVHSAHAE